MNHAKTGIDRVPRPMESGWTSVNQGFALIRVVEPEEDVHQRRFARTVFTEERVNFAMGNAEIDAVVRNHAGESFDDSSHFDRWRRWRLAHQTSSSRYGEAGSVVRSADS